MNRRELEKAAIDAHNRGMSWSVFWPTIAQAVAAAAGQAATPWGRDNAAHRRIVARLSHLLTCGDVDGMTAAGDVAPWQPNNDPPMVPMVPIIDDTTTTARCLWSPTAEK